MNVETSTFIFFVGNTNFIKDKNISNLSLFSKKINSGGRTMETNFIKKNFGDKLIYQQEENDLEDRITYTTFAKGLDKENIIIFFITNEGIFTDDGYTIWNITSTMNIKLNSNDIKIISKIANFYGVSFINNCLVLKQKDDSSNYHDEISNIVCAIVAINTYILLTI